MECFKIPIAVIGNNSEILKYKMSIKITAEIICVQKSRVL